jgi:hypothetical protein
MYKSDSLSFLCFKTFEFGEQKVSQFIIFEWKYLFSIIIFYFHKTNGCQDRFHTHAFNAISIKLFGNYEEQIINNEFDYDIKIRKRNTIFLYIPKDSFHRITKSNGCCTVLFTGRWGKNWKERLDTGELKFYSWGRN